MNLVDLATPTIPHGVAYQLNGDTWRCNICPTDVPSIFRPGGGIRTHFLNIHGAAIDACEHRDHQQPRTFFLHSNLTNARCGDHQ